MSLPLSRTARRLGFRGRAEGPDTAPARPPLPIPMIFEPPEAARAKWMFPAAASPARFPLIQDR